MPPPPVLRLLGPLPHHLAAGGAQGPGPASQPAADGRRPLPAERRAAGFHRGPIQRIRPSTPGLDFKYGLTPSLTLDLSWKTDFAQVETDQEQVNLTRFNLFFPEKRDFFLEGAGIFEFGERVERQGLGGPPPTLLFYSRRIGIEEGHNLPVLAGGKLTGRAGPYQVGALRMTTQAMTFVDEGEEDRFLTDGGDLLDEEQAELSGEAIVDHP